MRKKPVLLATAPLSAEEWNFSRVPAHDLRPCFAYEFSRELCRKGEFDFELEAWRKSDSKSRSVSPTDLSKIEALCRRAFSRTNKDPVSAEELKSFRELREKFPTVRQSSAALRRIFSKLFDCEAGWPSHVIGPEVFPQTPWSQLSEAAKGEIRASVHPWKTGIEAIYGTQLAMLPFGECDGLNVPRLRKALPSAYHQVLGAVGQAASPEALEHGFFAVDWSTSVPQLIATFERWLLLTAARRKLQGKTFPSGATEKQLAKCFAELPVSRVPPPEDCAKNLNRLGAYRVKKHYSTRELSDSGYNDDKRKARVLVAAPYQYMPQLNEAAALARQLLGNLAKRAKE